MKNENIRTIIELFERSCTRFSDNNYLWEKREGRYQSTTYAEVKEEVLQVAGGLMTEGLEKGDRVALLSEGCNNWIYTELGILYAGGVNVPLSIKLTEGELIFRINHSDARFLFVSGHYLNLIRNIANQLPLVERIFVIGDKQAIPSTEKWEHTFTSLKEAGRRWLTEHTQTLQDRTHSVTPDDLVNISYTSGTTAEPKGIMLTHRNYVCNVLQSDTLIRIPEHYIVLLFLPWDHSFAHTVGIYAFMYNGASLAAVDYGQSAKEYLRNIPGNMKEVRPHILLSVPALAKNFRKNIEMGIRQQTKPVQWLYQLALKLSYLYQGTGNDKRKKVGNLLLFPIVWLFRATLFAKIRDTFGGRLQFFVGGGALLDLELQRYFCALGIPMYQGYGLSEASPVISTNRPQRYRFGSSGELVRPMDLKICDENGNEVPPGEQGEIVIRGGNVMKGYWKNETSTQTTIRQNWLFTGDMGYMEHGLLYVLGRFKSLLIANDGEKYSPEGIEEAIVEQSQYIDYCVLYNDQSPYTAGLIVPNKVALKAYLKRKDIEPGSVEGYKLMLAKIHKELMEFRYGGRHAGLFPERWLPAVIAILPEALTEENGTINSTSKIVRRRIITIFRDELEFVYTPEGKDIQNERNTRNIKRYFTE